MAFSIIFNFAIGIVMTAFPAVFIDNPANRGGLDYQVDYFDEFESGMGSTVTPDGSLQDTSSAIDRVLDMISVGFIQRLITAIDTYAYGSINFLNNIVGKYLEPDLQKLIFGPPVGILKSLLTFAYIVAAFVLWTGRNVDD